MNIRVAVPGDADAIAEVHVAAWRQAYQGLMPDSFLKCLSVEQKVETWRRGLEKPGPGTTLVCERSGDIGGFCVFGPSRDDDGQDGLTGELIAVNVHPHHWRKGLGRAMCEYVVAEAKNRDWTSLTLWVLMENHAARRFYEQLGFFVDGVEKSDAKLTGHPLDEIRYRKSLR